MTLKPMLAHKFDNSRVDWSLPVYIQPKLDGVRCLFTKMVRTLVPVNNLKT